MGQQMQNSSSYSSTDDLSALQEALHAQHIAIQSLQLDMELERECAASAASEALSMILRLQKEKASQEMEAKQYKRVAEERLHHVEESLVLYEELIYSKDMYISSLELQHETCHENILDAGNHDFENEKTIFCQMKRSSLQLMEHDGYSKPEFKVVDEDELLQWRRKEEAEFEANLEETQKETFNQISTSKDINVEGILSSASSIMKSDNEEVFALYSSFTRSSDSFSDLDSHSTLSDKQCASMVFHDVYEIQQQERKVANGFHYDIERPTTVDDMQPPSVTHISDVQSNKAVFFNVEDKSRDDIKFQLESANSSKDLVESKICRSFSQIDYLEFDQRLRRLESMAFNEDIQKSEENHRETLLPSVTNDQPRLSIQSRTRSLGPEKPPLPKDYRSLGPEKQSLPKEYRDYVTEAMMAFSL